MHPLSGNCSTVELLGEAILFSSIQFSIGSVEMSSKFSVKNFSNDQATLQNAADALSDYLKISIVWTLGVILLLYSKYKFIGLLAGLISNLIVILWIYFSYITAFKAACDKTPGLVMPKLHLVTPSV
uniref:Uncharacterized protein n=1 Tax=viral metagenome TaxID=1070528 RepID=A0A6C0CYY2_9ZZZZ